MKKIISANLKGGTGKTTLAILSARYLISAPSREEGKKILFIDLDLQCSSSLYFNKELKSPEKTIVGAVLNRNIIDNIIEVREGLDLVQSSIRISDIRSCSQKILQQLLMTDAIESKYDFIIIDTGRGINNISLSAISIADTVLSPVAQSSGDIESYGTFMRLLHEELEMKNQIFYVVRNQSMDNDTLSDEYTQYTRNIIEDYENCTLIEPVIPSSRVIKRAIDEDVKFSLTKRSKTVYDPVSQTFEIITGIDNKENRRF